jgi:hypothetical protein
MSAAEVSDSTNWIVFGVLGALILISLFLWVKYLPKIRKYKSKRNSLNMLSSRYNQLCRERKDLVFHFYWAVDRGDNKEADVYEEQVLMIDSRLEKLKTEFDLVSRGDTYGVPVRQPSTRVD